MVLKGELSLLHEIQNSLANPVWQLYLGRKAFVPGMPVYLRDCVKPDCDNLSDALKSYPYLLPYRRGSPDRLRLEIEMDFGQGDRVKHDQPVSFVSNNRQFSLRYVKADMVERMKLPSAKEESCIYLV